MSSLLQRLNPFHTNDWWVERSLANKHTPDINRLQSKESWWVFVYDNMQKGLPAHDFIKDASVVYGDAFTLDRYTMWTRKMGEETYPIVMDPTSKLKEARANVVKGQLVNMSTAKLIELDSARENTVQFIRRRVNLNFHYHEVLEVRDPATYQQYVNAMKLGGSKVAVPHVQRIRAWMYIANPEYWLDMVKIGRMTLTKDGQKTREIISITSDREPLLSKTTIYKPNNPNSLDYYYFSKMEFNGR